MGPVMSALLLSVLVGGALSANPVAAVTGGYACSNSDDDWGFGGSDVECNYTCPGAALVSIAVYAADTDAGTSGATGCGGAVVDCKSPGPTCSGESAKVSHEEDKNAKCYGESHEKWDNEVTVACAAVGISNPDGALCKLIPKACKPSLGGIVPYLPSLPEICGPSVGLPEQLLVVVNAMLAKEGTISIFAVQYSQGHGAGVFMASSSAFGAVPIVTCQVFTMECQPNSTCIMRDYQA